MIKNSNINILISIFVFLIILQSVKNNIDFPYIVKGLSNEMQSIRHIALWSAI